MIINRPQRMVMCLAYNGTEYHGWQQQTYHNSVQQAVETALAQLAHHPVKVYCAGRTDTAVHASKQVIHFETSACRDLHQWVHGTNFYLPHDIRILYASIVDNNFHARFSAIGRVYHYVIYQEQVPSVFLKNKVMDCSFPLDVEAMQLAAAYLLGEHDFSAFRGSHCQSKTPVRSVHDISLKKQGDILIIRCQANAFLHHMVRNIVGSLLEVGRGKKNPAWLKSVLLSKDRREAGFMAPASGLYLTDVIYPEPYVFPAMPFLWKW